MAFVLKFFVVVANFPLVKTVIMDSPEKKGEEEG